MNHFLSLEASSREVITGLIDAAARLKQLRRLPHEKPLAGQIWAMIFTKSSTRTRVSFEVGIRGLGGSPLFLAKNEIQLGRGEPIKDTARVLGRMVQGAVIRTSAHGDLEEFAEFSNIPTINALTDDEHPCQILADLMTVREAFGGWAKKKVAFIGDGACNVARSWMWAAQHLGFELAVASPEEFLPSLTDRAQFGDHISFGTDPAEAAEGASVVYTDVWVSMGKEEECASREAAFVSYQVNESLMSKANSGAIVMHCLPAYRGKEITEDVLEAHADTIFRQAENRLHVQKAVLAYCVS